jgi:mono/diheme cytochrome c family protein
MSRALQGCVTRASRRPAVKALLVRALASGAALAALAGVVLAAKPAAPSRSTDAANGARVYAYWCAECHARGPQHPGTQSLEIKYRGKVPAALEDRTDLSPDTTRYFVRRGFALMPPFRKTEISDEELRDLAAWLARKR